MERNAVSFEAQNDERIEVYMMDRRNHGILEPLVLRFQGKCCSALKPEWSGPGNHLDFRPSLSPAQPITGALY